MGDGNKKLSVIFNFAEPTGLNVPSTYELRCKKLPSGRRCQLSVNGVSAGVKEFPEITGDIVTDSSQANFGNVNGSGSFSTTCTVPISANQ